VQKLALEYGDVVVFIVVILWRPDTFLSGGRKRVSPAARAGGRARAPQDAEVFRREKLG
jgi:hypothetical protein